MQGVTLKYTFDILTDNNKLLATVSSTGPTVNEQAKALSEGFLGGMGLLTQGADVAAGQGMEVDAVDRDPAALAALRGVDGVRARQLDLEGESWPLAGERYDAVVVANYLHRPRFDALLALLAPGGVLIYETFMAGNERFGKPSSPAFLLQPGELLARMPAGWMPVAFEQGEIAVPRPAVVQRLCAVKGGTVVRLP